MKPFLRLNGWQRIGIVVSMVWVIVGGILGNYVGHNRDVSTYNLCLYPGDCTQSEERQAAIRSLELQSGKSSAAKYYPYYATVVAFIPIPIGWLVIWGIVALLRWIKGGFDIQKI